MEESIENFSKQFSYIPVVENGDSLSSYGRIVVAGMGGSALAARILQSWKPELPILIHQDYGLPKLSSGYHGKTLIIAVSHSGNTEETISAFIAAHEAEFDTAVITTGGVLAELAQKYKTPLVRLPNENLQPRIARGHHLLALLKILKEEQLFAEVAQLSSSSYFSTAKNQGKMLAHWLSGAVPVIYAAEQNKAAAYTWKIVLNETAKIPAFYNILPELNHNEMASFESKELSSRFRCVILRDAGDPPKILKRIDILTDLYKEFGIPVQILDMKGNSRLERIFSILLVGDWTAYFIAEHNGTDPEHVTRLEKFKKMI